MKKYEKKPEWMLRLEALYVRYGPPSLETMISFFELEVDRLLEERNEEQITTQPKGGQDE